MTLLSSLLDRVRRDPPAADGRRRFLRGAGTLGAAAVTGALLADGALAAPRLDVPPGTVVDARGNPVEPTLGGDPLVGEIGLVPYNFAPRGWAFCHGQLLSIAQNTALFSLLGTTYGGDGRTTFGLPDLQGRAIVGPGRGPGLSDVRQGQTRGQELVALTGSEIPSHQHQQVAVNLPGTTRTPGGNAPAADSGGDRNYASTATAGATLGSMNASGGGQSHENRPPYLTMNYIISLQGAYPSRS